MTEQNNSGEQVRREVMGDAFVDRALNNATDFTQSLWASGGPSRTGRASG